MTVSGALDLPEPFGEGNRANEESVRDERMYMSEWHFRTPNKKPTDVAWWAYLLLVT